MNPGARFDAAGPDSRLHPSPVDCRCQPRLEEDTKKATVHTTVVVGHYNTRGVVRMYMAWSCMLPLYD
jgi:hypothetical protein